MDLNLDALSNAIIEEYKRRTGDEKLVEEFIASVGEQGTYSDVYKLAKKAGLNLEQAIINQWTFDAGEVYFGTLKELLKKTTGPMHDDIAKACLFIQDKMNKAAGIKLKSQFAPINEYDLGDIAERMKNQGITKLMGELQTLSCKMVDDNQQANMELQTSAGYEIFVSRTYDEIGLTTGAGKKKDCEFCINLEGSYEFKNTREARKSGVFARHPKCGCVIDYTSKRTGRTDYNIQNFHKAKTTLGEIQNYEVLKREKQRAANAKRSNTMTQKWADRKAEVAYNLERLQKSQEFYGSPKGREVMRNLNRANMNYMSNSFKPQYGKGIKLSVVNGKTVDINLEKVKNSKFDIWIQEDARRKDMAVKYLEKHLAMVQSELNLVDIPTVRIIDFEMYVGNNAIASYDWEKKELYWNSKYVTENSVQKFLNKTPGFFASTEINSPIRHELGHRFYEETINLLAKNSNISYYDAKNQIDFKLLKFIQTEKNADIWLAENVSMYAARGYSGNKLTEVVAEALASMNEKTVSKEIIKIMKGEDENDASTF